MTRRHSMNPFNNEAGLVEKYIGTAYDHVKNVSNNLNIIEEVNENLPLIQELYQGPEGAIERAEAARDRAEEAAERVDEVAPALNAIEENVELSNANKLATEADRNQVADDKLEVLSALETILEAVDVSTENKNQTALDRESVEENLLAVIENKDITDSNKETATSAANAASSSANAANESQIIVEDIRDEILDLELETIPDILVNLSIGLDIVEGLVAGREIDIEQLKKKHDTSVWESGLNTNERIVSPAKVAAAIAKQSSLGWETISTADLSLAPAQVDFTLDASRYSAWQIIMRVEDMSADAAIRMRLSMDGGTTFLSGSTDYYSHATGGSASATSAGTTGAYGVICGRDADVTVRGAFSAMTGLLTIPVATNRLAAKREVAFTQSDGSPWSVSGRAGANGSNWTSPVNAIRLYTSTGTFTYGTIIMQGLRK